MSRSSCEGQGFLCPFTTKAYCPVLLVKLRVFSILLLQHSGLLWWNLAFSLFSCHQSILFCSSSAVLGFPFPSPLILPCSASEVWCFLFLVNTKAFSSVLRVKYRVLSIQSPQEHTLLFSMWSVELSLSCYHWKRFVLFSMWSPWGNHTGWMGIEH